MKISRKSIVFVGQAPSRSSDPKEPLSGRCGRFLAGLLDAPMSEFLSMRRVNLNASWSGKRGKGDGFDPGAGKKAAATLSRRKRIRAVLLGRNVARCFGLRWFPLAVARDEEREFLMLPHPSGVNRWWNDSANFEAAKKHVRRFVYGCGHETW